MHRRFVLIPLALVLVLATVHWGCEKQPPEDLVKPVNVVLISIDSLRADHLAAYGYGRETSPNVDRLAQRGALFENVIAESSWTLPTHVSMLTGLSSDIHGVELDHKRLSESIPTLASRLRDAGYRTSGIYSGAYLHPAFGFGTGFDEYHGVYGKTELDETTITDASSARARRAAVLEANRLSHRTVSSPAITERAIEFLSESSEKPFFLFLHYFDVHYDYMPPEADWRPFDPHYQGTITGENFLKNPDVNPEMSREDLDHIIALYDGEIAFTDRHIGYLLDAIEQNGLAENTLVVITSDHGEEFFEHGQKGHRRTLYDEVLKVPLVMRLPGRISSGARISEQVRHVDVAPTILSLLGVPRGEDVSGTSLEAHLAGKDADGSTVAVSRLVHAGRQNVWISRRTADFKQLVNEREKRRREFLFELTHDPEEQIPLDRDARSLEVFWRNVEATESKAERLRARYESLLAEDAAVPDDIREQLESLGYVQSRQ